jgi:predicted branched-subunit amino acid permease
MTSPHQVWTGARDILPFAVGVAIYGLAFGVLAAGPFAPSGGRSVARVTLCAGVTPTLLVGDYFAV